MRDTFMLNVCFYQSLFSADLKNTKISNSFNSLLSLSLTRCVRFSFFLLCVLNIRQTEQKSVIWLQMIMLLINVTVNCRCKRISKTENYARNIFVTLRFISLLYSNFYLLMVHPISRINWFTSDNPLCLQIGTLK